MVVFHCRKDMKVVTAGNEDRNADAGTMMAASAA